MGSQYLCISTGHLDLEFGKYRTMVVEYIMIMEIEFAEVEMHSAHLLFKLFVCLSIPSFDIFPLLYLSEAIHYK